MSLRRKTRCCFVVASVLKTQYDTKLNMHAIKGKQDEKNIPNAEVFTEFTPSAKLEISIMNPALVDAFAPGEYYYVDLIPVETP